VPFGPSWLRQQIVQQDDTAGSELIQRQIEVRELTGPGVSEDEIEAFRLRPLQKCGTVDRVRR